MPGSLEMFCSSLYIKHQPVHRNLCSYNLLQLHFNVMSICFLDPALFQSFSNSGPSLLLQSSTKSMEQELRCPVCDEMVKQPILLPCQHSVCLLCAAEVLVQRGYPPPDLPPEPNSPASTPNTRSPRGTRRPTPRTPDRLERVLKTGRGNCFYAPQLITASWVVHLEPIDPSFQVTAEIQ